MKAKTTAIALAILTAFVLAGCSADRWIGVEPGEYVVANTAGTAIKTASAEIQNGIYVMSGDGADQRWLMNTDAPGRWPMDTTRVRFVEVASSGGLPRRHKPGSSSFRPFDMQLAQSKMAIWYRSRCDGLRDALDSRLIE